MTEALADRIAEAFAEYLHEYIRKTLWGYAKDETLEKDDLLKLKYSGIRPAPGYPSQVRRHVLPSTSSLFQEHQKLDKLLSTRTENITVVFHPCSPQPDHTEKSIMWELMKPETVGIGITESLAMTPPASVSGLVFAHPESKFERKNLFSAPTGWTVN